MAKKYLSTVSKDPLWYAEWVNVTILTDPANIASTNVSFTFYEISDSAKEAFDNLGVFKLGDIISICETYNVNYDAFMRYLPSVGDNFNFGYSRSSGDLEAVMICRSYFTPSSNEYGEFRIKDSTLRQTIQSDVVKVPQFVTELPSTISDDAVGTIYYVPVKQYTYNCQAPVDNVCVYDPVITLNEGDTIVVNSDYGATKCGLYKPGGVLTGSYIVSEPPITYTAAALMDVRIGTLNDDQGAVYQIIRANDIDLDGKWIITERYVDDEVEYCAPDFVVYSLSYAAITKLNSLSTPFTIWDLKDICGSSLDGITLPSDGTNFQFGYSTNSSGRPDAVVDCEYCYSPQRGRYHTYIASKTSGGTTYYKKLTDEEQMTIRQITDSDGANINVELDCCYIDKRSGGASTLFILPPVLDYGANLDSQVVHRIEFYLNKPNSSTSTSYAFMSSDGKTIMKLSGLTFNSSYEYFLTATWNGFVWTIDYVRVNNY